MNVEQNTSNSNHCLRWLSWFSNWKNYRIHSNCSALSVSVSIRCIMMGAKSDFKFFKQNHRFHLLLCAKSLMMKGAWISIWMNTVSVDSWSLQSLTRSKISFAMSLKICNVVLCWINVPRALTDTLMESGNLKANIMDVFQLFLLVFHPFSPVFWGYIP